MLLLDCCILHAGLALFTFNPEDGVDVPLENTVCFHWTGLFLFFTLYDIVA
jgi:hypothetical protein